MLVLNVIRFIWGKESMREDDLLHNILELQKRLEKAEQRLDVALQGLKIISDGSDTFNVASKTLDEIDTI